jgi:hypothetical protein
MIERILCRRRVAVALGVDHGAAEVEITVLRDG